MLGKLARQHDPNVLVGFDTADDAGVYRLTPELALVQTVDFFTPIVDDPYVFGQIAATNSLSDVYAMGGRPISALALVCFPEQGDTTILEQMLAGGLSKMVEAGCTVIGGHSIKDDEIKLGYAVTGTVHPARVLANNGAKPGDRLVFTKAIGTGVISTAIKRGHAGSAWVRGAVHAMTTLNKTAAEVVITGNFAVHAMTDVTGFGLIGHAREVAKGSGVSVRIFASEVPLLEGALECVPSWLRSRRSEGQPRLRRGLRGICRRCSGRVEDAALRSADGRGIADLGGGGGCRAIDGGVRQGRSSGSRDWRSRGEAGAADHGPAVAVSRTPLAD